MVTTNVGRFCAAHGVADIDALRRRSVDDPEWFWAAAVQFLGLPFAAPWTSVLDTSRGIEWATWFNGATLNVADVCVDRWARDTPEQTALVWEGEDGATRRISYVHLRSMVDTVAHALEAHGVTEGDAVGLFMPMVPETVAALMAVAKLGAVFLPLFSGFAAGAVASRLADAGAKALMTAESSVRRGNVLPMLDIAVEAAAQVPTLTTIICLERPWRPLQATAPEGVELLRWPATGDAEPYPPRMVDAEHPLLIAYTSGTTGRPKGSVHVHGGFTAKVAEEAAFQFDCRPDDTLFWFTDMGWIMGPWEVIGTLAQGATMAMYEGAPDWPQPDRLWALCAAHRVSILGIGPTLVRAMLPHGDQAVRAHDLSALRVLGSTGEPWNEAPWRWFFEVVGGGRCPVINISGGTEIGACFLSPHPVEPIEPMSLGGPSLGLAMAVVDDEGQPVEAGTVGELVCTAPWPGMTRGLYKDPERYLDTYWRRFPGMWAHGDWASVDGAGQWFLHGRSDDTIKVAGKRLGPAEVESLLVGHPAVVEAAAVGLPDEVKGEALWCYVVLAPGFEASDDLRRELTGLVADALGSSFRPSAVRFTSALPKTRNAKVLRRAIRATAVGADMGDLSGLEDPSTIDAVRAAR